MTGIGIKVSVPFLNNQTGSSKLNDLKSHMLGWYDVKRQGCTNESLAENPVLEDLSDGQYVFDFNQYTNHPENVVNSRVIKGTSNIYYPRMTADIESFTVKVKRLTAGQIVYYYRLSTGKQSSLTLRADGVYTIPKCYDIKDSMDGTSTGFLFNGTNEGATVTMLPTKHPLELKNFAFGGLSGMGGYGTDLTKWTVQGGAILSERTPHKVTVHLDDTVIGYKASFRFQNENKERYDYFKVRTSVPGNMTYSLLENVSNTMSCYSEDKMTFEVYGKGIYRATFMPDNGVLDYTIEILPNFPNSLVFNGVTPEYVINKDNVTLGNVATAVGVNKFKLTGNHYRAISYYITGKAGESLTVSIPSFIVRVTGIEAKSIVQISYKDSTGNHSHMNLVRDGTYTVPAINYTLDTKEDGSAIKEEAIRILTDGNIHDVTLESLPNYPAPTTKMYGIIPTLTHGAKCMMMDFVPTFPIEYIDYVSYYTQRQEQAGNQYALMTNKGGLITIAYNNFNSNGTYINGQYNDKLRHIYLLNKRQVVSVNANEVYEMPANRGVVIATDETLTGRFPTMALNSLILFDRELTEEEMKLVMGKLIKYEDTDNIAGDLSRSANVLSFDDSGMYEEYDAYEDEQEIIEAPTEFNDNTV